MVLYREYDEIPVSEMEIRRYARMMKPSHEISGSSEENKQIEVLLRKCIDKALEECTYRVCYAVFPLKRLESDGLLDLEFARTDSMDLRKNLTGCDRVVLFAATVGPGMDRLVTRAGKLFPAEAMLYQAIGAERVESLCDRFCHDLQKEYGTMPPRFSPGYGDLPLSLQNEVFQALDCPRKIGLTLNQSLLMSPMKSVTALVGIRSEK